MGFRVFDDLGREHVFLAPARRIVSLVPSDTASVVALGAGEQLVGRTDYCVEPAGLRQPSVGGTKSVRVQDVVDLAPDLVLANKEENTKAVVSELVAQGIRVFVAFPQRAADGVAQLARLARLLGRGADAATKDLVRDAYTAVREAETAPPPRALETFVPIWIDPWMTVHESTYISDVMGLAGFRNVFADRRRMYPLAADLGRRKPLPQADVEGLDTRYPRVTVDEIVARAPEIVLLPDEPHPFGEKETALLRALDVPAAKHGTIVPCSGRDLSWPGVHTAPGLRALRRLHAELLAKVPHAS